MRQSTLTVLFVVTVISAIAAIVTVRPDTSPSTPTETSGGPALPELKGRIDSVAKMVITGPDGTIGLLRAPVPGKPAEGWTLSNKGDYPVMPSAVQPVIDGLLALRETEPMTAQPKLYSRLDLADPGKGSEARLIELNDASGAPIARVILGKRKYDPSGGGNDGIYMRLPDQPQTWLAAPAISVPGDGLALIDRTIVNIDPGKIKEMTLTSPTFPALNLARAKTGDKLAVQDAPKDSKFKTDDPGAEIASGVQALELDDVKPVAQVSGIPAGAVHVLTFDGLAVDLSLVVLDDLTWVTVSATGSGEAAKQADEITRRTKGWAYQIAKDRAETLEKKLADVVDLPATPIDTNPHKSSSPAKPPAARAAKNGPAK